MKKAKVMSKQEVCELIANVDNLFEVYCVQITKKGANQNGLIWEGDLGGRTIYAQLAQGCVGFAIGMENGALLTTDKVKEYAKKMLADFEDTIKRWQKDHPLCAKNMEA